MRLIWNPRNDIEDHVADSAFDQWGDAPALSFHRSLESYRPTPLTALPGSARKLGVGQILVKDESYRFGLNSFKGLGCSYALVCCLCEQAGIPADENAVARLQSPEVRSRLGERTFITATDGNHGRGLAWAAKMLGHRAVVYMPEGSTLERLENIRSLGAEARILPLNYDDAVRAAAEMAEKNGWILVQDTAWPGYEEVPRRIMEGYSTMVCEIETQLTEMDAPVPTHLFLQAGVGSMAGAVAASCAARWNGACPRIVVVEPDQADCYFRTAQANDGAIHAVTGKLDSMMAGLCCGEPSPLGWEILGRCATAFVSCEDECAARGMRMLGRPESGDAPIVSGESGAVTMGVLAELMVNPQFECERERLGLNADSHVLLISTEGDTDQANYRRILDA